MTTRRDAWAGWELQVLYDHVNDADYYATVQPLLPARSRATIRNRMCKLREEAGIKIRSAAYGQEPRRVAG